MSSASGSGASKASAAPPHGARDAAGAEHERGDPRGLAHLPGTQALERLEEHLLYEVRRRLPVTQVAQAIEPHARAEPPVKLCFGCRIGRGAGLGNPAGERAVVERGEMGFLRHGRSIAIISKDV